MRRILRVLGILCSVAAGGCTAFLVIGEGGPSRWASGLMTGGVVFLALAMFLDRFAYLESLLKSSATAGTDRIKTNIGDFQRLRDVEGQATCLGCGGRAPKTDLYYSKPLNVYYHPECLARDRSR